MKCMMCGKETDEGFMTTKGNFVCWECGQNAELTMCSKCTTVIEEGDPFIEVCDGEFLCIDCAYGRVYGRQEAST
ncbi:hypothetical protein [Mesotoga sp. UBA6090]|uniref:hypothetical protein n=1 Tax=Mesotoga sp. UBA6090 TaxID=1946860 RepID=UPI0025D0717E|nr:hypothetical protein [Mesotoga sp. UBA6090]